MSTTEASEGFVFDSAELETTTVTIGDKKYILSEASGKATSEYKNSMMKDVVFRRGNISKIKNMADADYVLLASCLVREKTLIGTGETKLKEVTADEVKAWKEKICKKLVDWIKSTSDMESSQNENQLALKKVFGRKDAPIKFEELQEWVSENLTESEVPEDIIVCELFEDAEESRKNG